MDLRVKDLRVNKMLGCMNGFDWTYALMNEHSIAVAYIHFQEAFESVSDYSPWDSVGAW